MRIRTIFIGTPDFGVPCLKALAQDANFEILGVISQPDRPIGRKQIIFPTPVKAEAQKINLSVWQPDKIKNFYNELKDLKPDLIIVAAYAQIIPENILKLPKFGCINVHGSLLPRHRGASCVQAAILANDQFSGVTIMQMEKGLDTGAILAQSKIKIEKDWTAEDLYVKISTLAPSVLIQAVKDYTQGKINPIPQDNSQATYAKMLKKEDGRIDWNKSAIEIERFIRAMGIWPGAYGQLSIVNYQLTIDYKPSLPNNSNWRILKILKAKVFEINQFEIGKIFEYQKKLVIQCGKDALIIERLQLEGGKPMTGEEFLRGHRSIINFQ